MLISTRLASWIRPSVPLFVLCLSLFAAAGCSHHRPAKEGDPTLLFPGETRLRNIRQLTFGGTNAEAYWSFDGQWLSYQHKGLGAEGPACDQIYRISVDGKERHSISQGKARTTCSFYFPNDSRILFSSTLSEGTGCPKPPDMSKGYVWPIYPSFQMYSAKIDGTDLFPMEPGAPNAYNAEATVCKDGSVIFTSDRDGDLDLYTAKLDPMGTISGVKRITNTLGYDGGAFFSRDCKQIVWRASRPRPGKETEEYRKLLAQHLVKPSQLEIWVANADGSHARQITRLGAASFAPYFTPDAKQVVFASNPRDPKGRTFDLYLIGVDGTGLERITYSNTFESFPMFSPDGKYLAFSSNRAGKMPRETNVFIADWVGGTSSASLSPQTDRFMAIARKLSSPEMEGRGPGTAGMKLAEDFTAEQFRAAGIRPFSDSFKKAKTVNGYFQDVQVKIHGPNKKSRIENSRNVLGAWGDGCGRVAPVVIGAHLDHLGYGAENSLELGKTVIHPGADDNASGVAAILEAARMIIGSGESLSRCYVFGAFTGEEAGIAGSSLFVKLLKDIGVQPKAMLNLDMVGRMEKNRVMTFGSDSAKEWKTILDRECSERRLDCAGGGDGYGPSDHMAFYIAKVPVIHFFTGPHADYHRASDTAEKLNTTGGLQVAELVAAVARKAAAPGTSLTYRKAQVAPTMGKVGGHRSKGAYLGTVPDYAALSSPSGPGGGGEEGGGVRLSGTRSGSPAEQAGVKEGDVLFLIQTMDPTGSGKTVDHSIRTLDEFTRVLGELEPGQKITLGVRRDGAILKMVTIVGRRQ